MPPGGPQSRLLGRLRTEHTALQRGSIRYLRAEGGLLCFSRQTEEETLYVLLNRGDGPADLSVPHGGLLATDRLTGQQFAPVDGTLHLTLPPCDAMVIV